MSLNMRNFFERSTSARILPDFSQSAIKWYEMKTQFFGCSIKLHKNMACLDCIDIEYQINDIPFALELLSL